MASAIVHETKFLIFRDDYDYPGVGIKPRKYTRKRIIITTRRGGDILGEILWHGDWRQHCFFPERLSVWSSDCLRDVLLFLEKLNKEKTPGE